MFKTSSGLQYIHDIKHPAGIHIHKRVVAVWITEETSLPAGMKFVHISKDYIAPSYNLQSAMYLPLNATQYIQDEKGKHRDLFIVFSPTIDVQLPIGFPLTKNVHVEKVPMQVTLPPHCHLCKVTGGCGGDDGDSIFKSCQKL